MYSFPIFVHDKNFLYRIITIFKIMTQSDTIFKKYNNFSGISERIGNNRTNYVEGLCFSGITKDFDYPNYHVKNRANIFPDLKPGKRNKY